MSLTSYRAAPPRVKIVNFEAEQPGKTFQIIAVALILLQINASA